MKAWLHRLLDPLARWWLGADAPVTREYVYCGRPHVSDVPRFPFSPSVGPAPDPVETCPRCHNHMGAWKTYADGKRECLSCAHAPKRHR